MQFSNPGTGPLGPVEHMRGIVRAGYGYASFEAFDGSGRKDWSIWHTEAERNFLPQRPWAYCRTRDDLFRLCDVAHSWGQPPIVNLEVEATTTLPPKEAAEVIKDAWGGEFAVQTLPILYDSVDWSPLNKIGAVCILEAYANEIPALSNYDYLLTRAAPDFDRVMLSPGYYDYPPSTGTYPERSLYAKAPAPWLIYLGDNVHDWSDWKAP